MTEKDTFPLNPTLMRALNDKIYEKRKTAALEIERWVWFCLFTVWRLLIVIEMREL